MPKSWVYGLDHNGDRGKVRGAEGQSPFRYLGESEQGRRRLETCLLSAFGYGAEGPQEWWAKPHSALSPTHPYGRKDTEATQRDEMQTGR